MTYDEFCQQRDNAAYDVSERASDDEIALGRRLDAALDGLEMIYDDDVEIG
jgi:hypothetical protein